MPGYLLHVGASIICTHGAQASLQASNQRVKVGGQLVALQSDLTTVTGCPFMVGNNSQPCVKIQWVVPASRVRVNGQFVLLQTSSGICQSAEQIPQGPPNIVTTQVRVKGT